MAQVTIFATSPICLLIRTPPLYAANGVSAVVELYVAFINGTIIALDANTGVEIRHYAADSDSTTGLALGDTALYASGDGFLKALDRGFNSRLWRANTSGEARGGAIVTASYLVVSTSSGAIQLINLHNGFIEWSTDITTWVSKTPAVSGSRFF